VVFEPVKGNWCGVVVEVAPSEADVVVVDAKVVVVVGAIVVVGAKVVVVGAVVVVGVFASGLTEQEFQALKSEGLGLVEVIGKLAESPKLYALAAVNNVPYSPFWT